MTDSSLARVVTLLQPKHQVLSELARIGCCYRCALTLLNIGDTFAIASTGAAIGEQLKIVFPLEKCVCCFGMVQDASSSSLSVQSIIIQLTKELETANFRNITSFYFTFNLPVTVLVHRHAVTRYIRDLIHVELYPDVLGLKDVMRTLYGEGIQRAFGDSTIQQIPHSPFSIQLAFTTEPNSQEEALILRLQPGQPQPKRAKNGASGTTVGNAQQTLPTIPTSNFAALNYLPPPWVPCQLSVSLRMEHTLVGGNYVKLSRGLSQTPWELEGDRKTQSSVSEEIANPMLESFCADEYKFHSSGREDVDVRMLGNGRPFVLEFIQPHLKPEIDPEFFERMQQRINSSTSLVQVNNLRLFSNEQFQEMKDNVDQKKKSYRAVVWVSRPLEPAELEPLKNITDLVVNQQTPIRVLHRRSQLNREKIIHSLSADFINPHFLILDLTTSAGTYVKEFVHSDRGRCHPSLGSLLGCEADILQLDVMNLH